MQKIRTLVSEINFLFIQYVIWPEEVDLYMHEYVLIVKKVFA